MRVLGNHKVLGIVFLVLVLLGVWLTYALFTKQFRDLAHVTLETSRIGLQLPERGDVKIRGVIVGEVLDYHATDTGAEVTLGIRPDELDTIPADVSARIVPKTLFGQKYVELVVPEEPGRGRHLAAGAVIQRADVAIEVQQVLADLYPLLRTVQPADLNMTLNAVATALEGRGEELGANLETLDSYLKRLNPQIPELVEDLRLTAEVSDIYSDVLPEVSRTLRNTILTTGTLEEREAQLQQLFTDVAAFSGTAREFLDANGDNLVRLGRLGARQLAVLEKYAPEFPCLLGGIVGAGKAQAEAFRGFTLHIELELLPNQPRGYTTADRPRYAADRGPHCGTLPTPTYDQDRPFPQDVDFDDGVDEPTGKGTSRTSPFGAGQRTGVPRDSAAGFIGSAAETELLRSILAPAMGVPAEEVSDLGLLLFAPMARGAEVSLR